MNIGVGGGMVCRPRDGCAGMKPFARRYRTVSRISFAFSRLNPATSHAIGYAFAVLLIDGWKSSRAVVVAMPITLTNCAEVMSPIGAMPPTVALTA